jgi:deoxyribodipyrimidine photo-lyase
MKIREEALEKLKNFSENFLSSYTKDRNFDFGPDKRTNP